MQTNEADLGKLLADLNSRHRHRRAAATAKARALTQEQVRTLVDLEAHSPAYKRYVFLKLLLMFAVLVSCLSYVLCRYMGVPRYRFELLPLLNMTLFNGLLWYKPPFAHAFVKRLRNKTWKPTDIGDALDELYRLRASLQSGRDTSQADVLYEIHSFLKIKLARMNTPWPQLLTPTQQSVVTSLLKDRYRDVELTLALLNAMEYIGDESMLNTVRELANESRATPNMILVREAARACLPGLKERIAQMEQSNSLLRASDGNSVTTSNVLLRPAASNPAATPPEQLLHPTQSSDL